MPDDKALRTGVEAYCARLGADRLMVQAAGGNVSWKDDDTLWIKASGTWLADAVTKNIFVPVDLGHLRTAIAAGDFDAKPQPRAGATLRPSIETLLHALMPHRVVVHLHAIEVLARLVRADWRGVFARALPSSLRWAGIDYQKPGRPLAEAVAGAMAGASNVDVVFLGNHGVVIGGASVDEVDERLALLGRVCAALNAPSADATSTATATVNDYAPVGGVDIQRLARDPVCFARLAEAWALYPDHVVFLGAAPALHDAVPADTSGSPELIFVRDVGVFARPTFGTTKLAQLQCYRDVLVRQEDVARIRTLSITQIGELLDWDAEKYRQAMAK